MIKVLNNATIIQDQALALDFQNGNTAAVSVFDNGVSVVVVLEVNAATLARIAALEAIAINHEARLVAGGL